MATVTYIKETRQHPSAMVSVMRYCLQESKTVDQLTGQRYVSGIGCDGMNSITEFLATKYAYGKLDGINFYQYVQSFSPRENITYEQAHNIAREFTTKAWPGHEVQVTTHCDAKHIHSHFVINSVSFVDGHKLRQDPNTLKQLRAISDELCREHGLSVLPPYEKGGKRMGSREYRIAAKGKSWKFRLMYDVTQAMKVSRTKEDFIREMKRRGYEVKWTDERKNITFTCPNGMKCRDSRLHQEKYRKEHIEHELYTRQRILAGAVHGRAGEAEWTGLGGNGKNSVPAHPLRSAGGMAESRPGAAAAGGRFPAYPVQDDQAPGNGASGSPDAGRTASNVLSGEAGDDARHPEFSATGWESEREVFFRNLRNPAKQSQIYGSSYFGTGQQNQKAPGYHIGGIGGTLGAGLRGLASAGRLIEDDSEDPEERQKRIQAEQAGTNVGTILGLAIGAAMALTETQSPEEQQTIQDEQDFKEFLAGLEAEEEEHGFQQTM